MIFELLSDLNWPTSGSFRTLCLTNTPSLLLFLPPFSITTWLWQQRRLPRPQKTTSCFSTASCPTPPPPPPPTCSSTNRQPPLRLRWQHRPTGWAIRAAPAAWSHPAASVTLIRHTRPHIRAHTPHTRIPGWWPAGAALKLRWRLFTAGYPMLYRWTDPGWVEMTTRAQLESSNKQQTNDHKLNREGWLLRN